MIIVRVLLIAFNVALITYLIYRLVEIYRSPVESKKWIFALGIFLLLLPATMLLGFIKASVIYVLVYPIAIGAFLYFIKDEV